MDNITKLNKTLFLLGRFLKRTEFSENFIELEELKNIWKLSLKDFKKITNIVKNINKEELLVNAGNGDVKDFRIEYDREHISEIFKYLY